MSRTPDTSRDEEIARGLQLAEAGAGAPVSTPTTTATTAPMGPGTYVAMPGLPPPPPDASLAYTGVEIAPPSLDAAGRGGRGAAAMGAETTAMVFAKMQFLVQAIAVGMLAYWTYNVAFRAWWFVLTLGAVFCPLGWYGARKGSPRLLLAFVVWLCADLAFEVLFPFLYTYDASAVAVVVCLALVVFQFLAVFYVWNFRKMVVILRSGGASAAAEAGIDPLF